MIKKLTPEEEQELVEKAKESLAAFGKLYEYYLPKIYGYILNRVGSKEVAEDIAAETFIKAMKKIDQFEFRGFSFGSWLYRIAHNTICDYQRRNRPVALLNDGQVGCESFEESTLKRIDLNCKIQAVFQGLKDDYQEVLSLKFFEDLDNGEIARIVGLKPNNLNVKLHRSIKAFQKEYYRLYGEEAIL